MKKSIVISAMLAAISFGALAAPAADGPTPDCNGVKVATGPVGKGYSSILADIKKIVGNKIQLCEINTAGGLDNLGVLSTKEADIGIVQVDTWKTMKGGDESIAKLQKLVVLNHNYLHVVTATNGFAIQGEKKFGFIKGDNKVVVINGFSDLRGQRVAAVGSAQLLIRQLDKQLGFGMQVIDSKSDSEAFEMVKSGQVAAAVTVSGWPHKPIQALNQQSGLTLVPFNVSVGEPYKVKPLNYKNLAVYNNNSLGVQNVIVTRPFTGERAAAVAAVQQAIFKNLTELKEGNYQPAWNEVSVDATISEMTSFSGGPVPQPKKK